MITMKHYIPTNRTEPHAMPTLRTASGNTKIDEPTVLPVTSNDADNTFVTASTVSLDGINTDFALFSSLDSSVATFEIFKDGRLLLSLISFSEGCICIADVRCLVTLFFQIILDEESIGFWRLIVLWQIRPCWKAIDEATEISMTQNFMVDAVIIGSFGLLVC